MKAGVTQVPFESCCTGKTIRGILYNQILYIGQSKTRVLIGVVKLVIKVQTLVILLACGSKRTSLFLSRFDVICALSEYRPARPNVIYLLNRNVIVFRNVWKFSVLRAYRRPENKGFFTSTKGDPSQFSFPYATLDKQNINVKVHGGLTGVKLFFDIEF